MSKYIGRLTEIGFAKESSRGTFGGSITYWLPKLGFSFDNKANLVKSGESMGSIASETSGYITELWGEGEVEAEIRDKSFGLLLYALFGAVNSADESGARKHTFTLDSDSNQHPSLSIAYKDPDNTQIFRRGMIDKLTIKVALDEIVSFIVGFQSHTSEGWTALTPAYVAENKFIAKHLSFYVADSIAGLAGASETAIRELELTIEKNVIRDKKLGSLESADILNTNFRITGRVVLNQENFTFRNYALNGNVKAVRINLTNNDRTIGTTNPTLRIDFKKVIFEEWEADKSLEGIVNQSLNFTAYWDTATSKVFDDCYLINEVTSY
jgi:hypothetical protein